MVIVSDCVDPVHNIRNHLHHRLPGVAVHVHEEEDQEEGHSRADVFEAGGVSGQHGNHHPLNE